MLKSLSPSRLAVEAANLSLPKGVHSNKDEICALTGESIKAGMAILVPYETPSTFRDQFDMASQTSKFITVHTKAILAKPFLQKYSSSLITEKNWYPFRSNQSIGYFLRQPPSPPFIAFTSTAQQQHMIWRTPLTMNRDLLFIRVGTRLFRVYRPRLMAFYKQTIQFTELFNQYLDGIYETNTPRKHPFLRLHNTAEHPDHGQPRNEIFEMMASEQLRYAESARSWYRDLATLSSGEIWALGKLVATHDVQLAEPEPIHITV